MQYIHALGATLIVFETLSLQELNVICPDIIGKACI